MNKVKNFFRSKGLSFYFLIATALLLLVSMILYAGSARWQFLESTFVIKLSPVITVLFAVGLAAALVSMWREYELLSVGVFALSLLGCLMYGIKQASYLASIFVGIDGTPLSTTFVLTIVLSLAAALCALTAMILLNVKNRRSRKAGGSARVVEEKTA